MEGPISFWGYKEQESNLILPEHDDDDDDDIFYVLQRSSSLYYIICLWPDDGLIGAETCSHSDKQTKNNIY